MALSDDVQALTAGVARLQASTANELAAIAAALARLGTGTDPATQAAIQDATTQLGSVADQLDASAASLAAVGATGATGPTGG